MKLSWIAAATLMVSGATVQPGLAQISGMSSGPVTVAVKEITNTATGTWWWSPSVSSKLTGMLANELKSTGHFTVVERQGLKKVLSEQELADLGITRHSTSNKMGIIKLA